MGQVDGQTDYIDRHHKQQCLCANREDMEKAALVFADDVAAVCHQRGH